MRQTVSIIRILSVKWRPLMKPLCGKAAASQMTSMSEKAADLQIILLSVFLHESERVSAALHATPLKYGKKTFLGMQD